jgi:hypothetical protein
MNQYKCHRYTIERLYADMDRYRVQTLYVGGHLGQVEVPLAMIGDFLRFGPLIRDAFNRNYPEPSWTSPWRFKSLGNRVGLLLPNQRGKRNRNGLLGAVRMRSELTGRSNKPGETGDGRARTRAIYRNRTPASDAPLVERIQTIRSRRLAKASLMGVTQ